MAASSLPHLQSRIPVPSVLLQPRSFSSSTRPSHSLSIPFLSTSPSRHSISATTLSFRHSIATSLSASLAPPPPLDDNATCSPALMHELIEFLRDDLPHLFDERGITRDRYEKNVNFIDPITKYSSLDGYLFNIQMLRFLFTPNFELHNVKQTGPNEITTRWTMTMKFALLPWRPELLFTGISIMRVNPLTSKFISHVDYWDSIRKNEYFSFEGLIDLLKQLRYYKTPDLETPKYKLLKRTSTYEIRKYEPFIVVETAGDELTGSKGFKDVAGYIFGDNSDGERVPMTTPVITKTRNVSQLDVSIQIVLPLERKLSGLPNPLLDSVRLKEFPGGIVAAKKFSGRPTEDIVKKIEKLLRMSVIGDGLKANEGFMLARYNDPNRSWSFVMRNEVMISIEDFTLD